MSFFDDEIQPALMGAAVSKVEALHGYFQLCFDRGQILTVYNPTDLGPRLAAFFHDVVGRRVTRASETETGLKLAFEGDLSITVDLSEDARSAPEAMTLHRPGKPLVVW